LNGALIRHYCKASESGKSAFAMIDTHILAPLQNLLGPSGYHDNPKDLAPYLTDWRGRYTGNAAAMLSPISTAQVAEIVKFACAHRIALVPQGGNSGMVAGATPDQSGDSLLLSLRRMNKFVAIDAASGDATVEAGLILQTLHETVAPHGYRFPLTLGGKCWRNASFAARYDTQPCFGD
jgi:FAD/FMN-containing dehydrogenase